MHSLPTRLPLQVLLPICAFSICCLVCGAAGAADDAAATTTPHNLYKNRLPLSFEVNRGQADARAKFLTHSRGMGVFFTDQGAVLALTQPEPRDHSAPGARSTHAAALPAQSALGLRYQFARANPHPKIEPLDPLPGRSNYFVGNEPKRWHTDIAQFRRVRYRDIYPGVNVVYYGKDGQLEFDIEAAPGVDLSQVRLRVDGADSLALDDSGNLQLHTAFGVVTQTKPVVYQMIAGEHHEVSGDYVLRDVRRDKSAQEVAFRVANFDRRYALVFDPTLVFATLIGGTGTDDGNGVAMDGSGNSYVTGSTNSPAFPTTAGAYQTTPAGTDTFITKISADGTTLIYSALIGGNGNDEANGIGVDGNGNAYITGHTLSSNFPAVNALQPGKVAPDAAFVTALNAAGNGLNYSTYLGGNNLSDGSTIGYAIKADASGNAYVTGLTYSTTVPVSAGAFQMTNAGSGDAFVVKLNSSGAQVYGTYIGGSGTDEGRAIAIDAEGDAYVAGDTTSASINGVTPATLGPLGGTDMLIAELNPAGSSLVYATKIGGSGLDEAIGIAVDGGHQVYFAAFSNSTDLPPATPPQSTNGFYSAYVGHLDDSGTVLYDFASYGSSVQNTYGVAIDLDEARQSLYVTGYADGGMNTLPVLNPVNGLECSNPGNLFACFTSGAFLLQYTLGPVTLASASRVTAGNGTSTKLNAAAHDPVTGNLAAAGSSNGNPPTTVTPQRDGGAVSGGNPSPMNAGGDDLFEAIVNYLVSVPPLPPIVDKFFDPPTAIKGRQVDLTMVVNNPNVATPFTYVILADGKPACLSLVPSLPVFHPLSCQIFLGVVGSPNGFAIVVNPGASFPPETTCSITFRVQAIGPEPCNNVTNAVLYEVGGNLELLTGKQAVAHLDMTSAPGVTWNGDGSDTNTGNGVNWAGGVPPANGVDATFPAGVVQLFVTNDSPPGQSFNLLNFSGTGYDLGGATLNLEAGVNNSGADNTISAPIKAVLPLVFTSDPSTAVLNLSGGINLNGNNIDFNGAGTPTLSGTVVGVGDVNGDGIGNVIISASPGFTGNFNVTGGTFFINASESEDVHVFASGTLRGTGPLGAVTVDDSGTLFPGDDSTPVSLAISSLGVTSGLVELGWASNGTHSSINASGAVHLTGGTLKLDLPAQPTVGTVFNNLITAPATITGCFVEATTALPNVVVKPQCTASAVLATVVATDRIFGDGIGG